MRSERHRVLFLDRTNSARSQLAEALLRRCAGEAITACSAGIEPRPIPAATYLVLRELGVDPATIYSKNVIMFLARVSVRWAIILSDMGELGAPRIYPFAGETLYWPCLDPERTIAPFGEQLAAFRSTRDHLYARITAWVAEQGLQAPNPPQEGVHLARSSAVGTSG